MTTPPSLPHAPRRRDPEATRTRLRAAALELFTTIGFRATTTALIAERAGIAEGTIYRHVSGKDDLFAEVHRASQRWAADLVRATADPEHPLPARERLQRIGRRLFEAAAREPAQLRMALGRDTDPDLDDKGEEAAREFRELLLQVTPSSPPPWQSSASPAMQSRCASAAPPPFVTAAGLPPPD